MKSGILYLLIALLTLNTSMLVSCKKDIKQEDIAVAAGPTLSIPAASPVDGSLRGMVMDENYQPVKGAEVHFGALTFTTDSTGRYNFLHTTLDKYISTVTVIKDGYFKGIRCFSATAATNYVNIKLIPKILTGSFNSANESSVSLANGTSITFQENSIVYKANSAVYTGTVNVFVSYIDPTASDIGKIVPGCFLGRDNENLYFLRSAGMLAVEVETPGGEPLQLAQGKPASMKTLIPSSFLSQAPATIDTWSLDDKGVWVKEGVGIKSGNFYESQPGHFSFWNCDVPCNAIWLNVHVQDQNNNPVSNASVQLTVLSDNSSWTVSSTGQTDNMGNAAGYASDQEMRMDIFTDLICNTPVFTQHIGPFQTSSNVTTTVTFDPAQVLRITGNVTDCNNQPLQNGTAVIYTGIYGYNDVPVVNGVYSYTTIYCAPISSAYVIVLDENATSGGNSGNLPVSGNTLHVPTLNSCGSQPAVFSFNTYSGSCSAYFNGEFSVNASLSSANNLDVSVNVTVPGIYSITTATINGISFSGAGVFTTIGTHTVHLTGTGTPISEGDYNFTIQSAGIIGCPIVLNILPVQATFDFGGPGSCLNTIVGGNYETGFALDASHTVSFTLNVISPGAYKIYSSYSNGMDFRDSGVFVNAGPQNVVLKGTGRPQSAITAQFMPTSNHGSQACLFNVTTHNTSLVASYTFDGAPANCANVNFYGSYDVDSTLMGRGVQISVNVTSVGNYSIISNSADGISFSSTGTFTHTGVQPVNLIATGSLINPGIFSFVPQAQGISTSGCNFDINVN